MPKIAIYIGAEKTGTTSCQRFLAREKSLTVDGVSFQLLRNVNLREFAQRKIDSWEWDFPLDPEQNYIYVSEFFYRDFKTEPEVQRLSQKIANQTHEFEIFMRVRDQASWLFSFYSTYVRNGGVHELEDFLEMMIKKTDSSLNYGSRLSMWSEAFSKKNVYVGEYRQYQSVLDFMFQKPDQSIMGFGEPRINTALDSHSISDLLEQNRKKTGWNIEKQFVGKSNLELALTLTQKNAISKRWGEENRLANEAWGTNLPTS